MEKIERTKKADHIYEMPWLGVFCDFNSGVLLQ